MPEEGKEGQEPSKGQEPKAPESKEAPEPKAEEPRAEPKQFDEEYVKSLRSEAAGYRKEAQEAKAKAQEYEDKDKSELEKASGQRDKFKSEADEAKALNLRLRVALAKKLPMELIDRLKGDSQEEIEADADELLKLVKTDEKPTTMDGGVREPTEQPKSHEQWLATEVFGQPKQP